MKKLSLNKTMEVRVKDSSVKPKGQLGYSLIELMIGLSLGLVLTVGITSLYVQSSNNYERLAEEATRISNAQYIATIFRQEVQSAGYWGDYAPAGYVADDVANALIDPCFIDTGSLTLATDQPVYGFDSPGASPLICLPNSNFVPGTDVIILRRAASIPLGPGNPVVPGEYYIQSSPHEFVVEQGAAGYVPPELDASNNIVNVGTRPSGTAVGDFLIKRNIPNAPTVYYEPRTAPDSRRYMTSIIFVSPCTVSANGTDVCTGTGNDDGGSPFPSLKKLELSGVAATGFNTVVLAEGVEDLQLEYGIDISPSEGLASGAPDYFTRSPTPEELKNIVVIRFAALLRDEVPSQFTNNNTYTLLDKVLPPFGDRFARQVVTGTYRVANISSRRAERNEEN